MGTLELEFVTPSPCWLVTASPNRCSIAGRVPDAIARTPRVRGSNAASCAKQFPFQILSLNTSTIFNQEHAAVSGTQCQIIPRQHIRLNLPIHFLFLNASSKLCCKAETALMLKRIAHLVHWHILTNAPCCNEFISRVIQTSIACQASSKNTEAEIGSISPQETELSSQETERLGCR